MRESYSARATLHTFFTRAGISGSFSSDLAAALSILLSVLFLSSPATAFAAQAPGQPDAGPPALALTVNARLVVLDVSVTDSSGQPVEDLTAKDFQVFEDGKPQTIRSVEPPGAHTLPPSTIAAGISASFDPAQPAAFGHAPVNILVLDQLNTHFSDSSFARNCLHDYLAAQPALLSGPTTLFSIADEGMKQLAPFTRDRDALLRALAATPPEYAWKLEISKNAEYGPIERLSQSLHAIEQIAQSDARIPGRKNLIWVGGGFPSLDPGTIDRGDAQEVKDALEHVTDVLLDAHVTLYAVDPTSLAPGMTEITDSTQLEFAKLAGDALTGAFDPFSTTADFDRLGPITGGRVVRGRNDVAQQIASAVELGDHFYTVAYTPSSSSVAAAKFRKIRVVCLRPGLTISTRVGYYVGQTAQQRTAATAAFDLTTAAESTSPLNGLSVSVASDAASAAAAHIYTVRTGAAGLTWKPQPDGSAVASVYVMGVSLNAKNRMIDHTLRGMTATARPGANPRNPGESANFAFTVVPAKTAATLRFIVRDSGSGRMGSVDLPLTQH